MTELEWEREWWGDCANTYGEETKQITYARLMGLVAEGRDGKWPVYDLAGKSVVDIGGGPVSMLLKATNARPVLTVVDPLPWPEWVDDRYELRGIAVYKSRAEDFAGTGYDEAWIYNVLQHVDDPKRVVVNAMIAAPVVRIFDWLETPPSPGHPHTLRQIDLDRWLGGTGTVTQLNENGCVGLGYSGVFVT